MQGHFTQSKHLLGADCVHSNALASSQWGPGPRGPSSAHSSATPLPGFSKQFLDEPFFTPVLVVFTSIMALLLLLLLLLLYKYKQVSLGRAGQPGPVALDPEDSTARPRGSPFSPQRFVSQSFSQRLFSGRLQYASVG